MHYADDDDDSLDQSEFPDEADVDHDDGDGESETEPCPYCHRPIYEQAEMCPNCGKYIAGEDSTTQKPLWIVLGVVICLTIIVLVWVL